MQFGSLKSVCKFEGGWVYCKKGKLAEVFCHLAGLSFLVKQKNKRKGNNLSG